MKFLCDICKAKYQISDEKVSGKTVRMKCRRCGHLIEISAAQVDAATDGAAGRGPGDDALGGAPHTDGELLESLPDAGKPSPSAPRIHDEVTDEPTAVLPPSRGPVPAAAASQPFALTTPRSASSPSLRAVPGPRPLSAPPSVSAAPRPLGLVPRAGASTLAPATPRAPLSGPAAPRPLTARPLGLPTSPRPAPSPASALAPGGSPASAPSRAPEARPAPPAMEGALRRSVAEEPAPLTHPASAPTENWYVGVAGVPLGPIRLAVIREKAASGAVTGESLVWREGLDEWLPLRHFPELLELVEEARAGAARPAHTLAPASQAAAVATPPPFAAPPTLAPPVPPPVSAPPHAAEPASTTPPTRPAAVLEAPAPAPAAPAEPSPSFAPVAAPQAPSGPSGTTAVMAAARPVGEPAAAAAALPTLAPPPAAPPAPETPAPHVALPAPLPAAAAPSEPLPAPPPERRRAAMHPAAYAFIAMAAAFGGVAAFVLLSPSPPAPAPAAPVAAPATPAAYDPGAAAVPAPPPIDTGEAAASAATAAPVAPQAGAGTPRTGTGGGTAPDKGTPAAPIDTAGFGSPGGVAGPSATPAGPDNGSAGLPSTLTAGEIQGVVSANQASIRRKCWEPALDAAGANGKKSAKVTANVTIAPSGSVSAVSASGGGEFPGLASCIQTRIKGWKFPAAGGESRTAIPFVFASQ